MREKIRFQMQQKPYIGKLSNMLMAQTPMRQRDLTFLVICPEETGMPDSQKYHRCLLDRWKMHRFHSLQSKTG